MIAELACKRSRIARTGPHPTRELGVTAHDGDVDWHSFERAVEAGRRGGERGHAERGGEARGIVVRDEHVDITGVGRCIDTRAVGLDLGTWVGDRADAGEDSRGCCVVGRHFLQGLNDVVPQVEVVQRIRTTAEQEQHEQRQQHRLRP